MAMAARSMRRLRAELCSDHPPPRKTSTSAISVDWLRARQLGGWTYSARASCGRVLKSSTWLGNSYFSLPHFSLGKKSKRKMWERKI
ncbi:MAG: hypothetical protein L0Z53_16845, partial [Acidobacteriales bacterium]|nr:hypothetical protein [Terriglobales bacterium]